jgi:putative CocE/NonD family hydrolase
MPRRSPLHRALLTLLAALALGLAALTVVGSASTSASAAPPPSAVVRPGATQLEVLYATPGQHLELVAADDAVAGTGTVDSQGSFEWRLLKPGTYSVRDADNHAVVLGTGAQVTAFDAPAPGQSFYDDQHLTPGWSSDGLGTTSGFNLIETRDGTTLSANVRLPGPAANGPYPTVVEYSGYDPSNPANTSMATIFNSLGFAYVGVNIRGTGCSGGSYEPFEPVQSLDGYDAIEAIAAQPWAQFHKVGLVGISYPGISQLYAARTQPPHLAAITPLSVLDDSYRATLWPGGILNTGFAVPWASARYQNAKSYGEGWEQGMVNAGFAWCADNQRVRDQNPDPVALISDNHFYNKTYYEQIDPSRFASKINVPVYLGGAWQDEQTGGHFPDFLNKFTHSPAFFATISNGGHVESLANQTSFNRYADFLNLYVARRVPDNRKYLVGPALAHSVTGINGISYVRGNDYTGMTYAQAKRLYDSQGHIRIMFESGAAKGEPAGAPAARFEKTFSSWPIPGRKVTRLYLRPRGGLSGNPVTQGAGKAKPRSFSADPSALPTTDFDPSGGNNIWGADPTYDWRQIPKGKGLGWITSPLQRNVVTIGSGSLDVWVKTPARDVDLEATITDVRRNGKEVYVQSGWLRASHRRLDASRSTVVKPVHTDLARDARDMPFGTYQKLRLEIFPFAQPFRKGDRIRITLDAPGNARPSWAFDTIDHGQKVTVATDKRHQSLLALTVVPGVSVPKQAPPCGTLRSQPCRSYGG